MNQAEPVRQSLLGWMYSSVGFFNLVLMILVALICFMLTVILVMRGRGPTAAAALVLTALAPFFLGLFLALQGTIAAYAVIATSATTPKPSELAEGISAALMCPLVSLFLMAPSFLVALIGSFARALTSPKDAA